MQPLAAGPKLAAYQAHLQRSHDLRIEAQVLNLNEQPVGQLDVLDGQVNLLNDVQIKRKATLTISDVDGALLFGATAAWSGTTLFADRLVRIRHTVTVPGYGEITATPFVGVPVIMSRRGVEVDVELWDKAALGIYGSKPYTVGKGMNAVNAIKAIMADRTGEFRFRMPALPRRLSKAYSVGWTDEASPFAVAQRIASAELGMGLFYSGDGYLMIRKAPNRACTTFAHLLEMPTSSVDFTLTKNAAIVKGTKVTGFRMASAANPLSAASLARKGVPRWLPVVVENPEIKKQAGADGLAARTLAGNLGVAAENGVAVVPMFHHDWGDLVGVHGQLLRLTDASIPLGVGGPMTIGVRRWVSRPPKGNR